MSTKITKDQIQNLRHKTGAGMMDCKKALERSCGDVHKAIEYLRMDGLASAEKKKGRVAAQGAIVSYIHTGQRLGVLLELNCETDFVARREEFQQLAQNIAMQVAASPPLQYISVNDIPLEVLHYERIIELGKKDLVDKPEEIKHRIIDARMWKNLRSFTLLGQPYIKDSSITIDDLINLNISLLGENIKVARFIKFALGENESNDTNK